MRLWSIHPEYLDTKGLIAVWREGLLAQRVLQGKTTGYKSHPQLERFKIQQDQLLHTCSRSTGKLKERDQLKYKQIKPVRTVKTNPAFAKNRR